MSHEGLRRRVDATAALIVAATLAALALRGYALGGRVAHWDEARVAYWILETMATGEFRYRPVIHGPLVRHATRISFEVFGLTDAAMRVPVALLGGLLPLAAFLFRGRLTDREIGALALVLAFDPTLLYYSRFMRSDVPLAAFALVAVGFVVRAIDTGRIRNLLPAAVALGLAAASKENVLAYLAAWLGAVLLLFDHRLLRAGAGADPRGRAPLEVFRDAVATGRRAFVRALPVLPVALLGFLAVVVWAYAPRSPDSGTVALGNAIADPALWPAVVEASTLDAANRLYEMWVVPRTDGRNLGYVVFLGALLKDLLPSAPIAVLGVAGALYDRYSGAPRDLPAFALFWTLLSLVGYPAITDVAGPWLAVHLLVPLAIPAAVAVAALYTHARTAIDAGDSVRARRNVAVLVVIAVSVGSIAVATSFVAPQSPHNELAQYAQPADDLDPATRAIDRMGAAPGGPDVLFYGPFLVDDGGPAVPRQPGCVAWFDALPLPWYTQRSGAQVRCAENDSALTDDLPPIVIANASEVTPMLRNRTDGYNRRTYLLRIDDTRIAVFVDPSHVPDAAADRATARVGGSGTERKSET